MAIGTFAVTQDGSCWLCEANERDPSTSPDSVFVGIEWRVAVHRSGLLGWLLVVPRRHITSLAELKDAEAGELGKVFRSATRALVACLRAEKTYTLQFSEETPHLHFSLIPRMTDLPESRRGVGISEYNKEPTVPDDERDALARDLRKSWW
jgi:diadenosine tetraphosphate (Ap4A) HIT family hydrolase